MFFFLLGSIQDVNTILEFAALGVYCQLDFFGYETSNFQLSPNIDLLSDAQRINCILKLIEEGHEKRITISQDIHTKHRLVRN